MTIVRDGVEIVLTSKELEEAFFEQQHLFDVEDVVSYFDEFDDDMLLDDYEMTRAEIEQYIPQIVHEYRRNIDKYDMDWLTARDEAISEVLCS